MGARSPECRPVITRILAGLLALTAVAGFTVLSVDGGGNAAEKEPAAEPAAAPAPSGQPAPRSCPPLRVDAAIPYWDQRRAEASFRNNVGAIHSITLFWYFVRSDGSVDRYSYAEIDRGLLGFARDHGVTTYALIANLPGEPEPEGEWDWRRVQRAIASPESRERHVAEILALVEDLRVDGVNIDYEELQTHQTDEFTAFIKLLSQELHARGKRLAISAFFQEESDGGNHGQDLDALARYADELVMMGYDEHYNGSRPGPVASLRWVAEGLAATAKAGVPDDRLMLGVPFYGYLWPNGRDGAKSLVHHDVTELVRRHGATPDFDEDAAAPHFRVDDGTVWFENGRSSEAKFRLARDAGVRGVYLWRLGGEDPTVWEALSRVNGECG